MTLPTGTREADLIVEVDKWQKRARMFESIVRRVWFLMVALIPIEWIDETINKLIARAQVMK